MSLQIPVPEENRTVMLGSPLAGTQKMEASIERSSLGSITASPRLLRNYPGHSVLPSSQEIHDTIVPGDLGKYVFLINNDELKAILEKKRMSMPAFFNVTTADEAFAIIASQRDVIDSFLYRYWSAHCNQQNAALHHAGSVSMTSAGTLGIYADQHQLMACFTSALHDADIIDRCVEMLGDQVLVTPNRDHKNGTGRGDAATSAELFAERHPEIIQHLADSAGLLPHQKKYAQMCFSHMLGRILAKLVERAMAPNLGNLPKGALQEIIGTVSEEAIGMAMAMTDDVSQDPQKCFTTTLGMDCAFWKVRQ